MSMIGNYLRIPVETLDELYKDSDQAEVLAYPEDEDRDDALDIDKSWHLIHFLLTGKSWGGDGPLANAVLGGDPLPHTDAGYGPFRVLEPEAVKATAKALAEVSGESLWTRFNVKKVAAEEIYPIPWRGDTDDRDYVLHNFEALKKYFLDAAASGNGMLLWIA